MSRCHFLFQWLEVRPAKFLWGFQLTIVSDFSHAPNLASLYLVFSTGRSEGNVTINQALARLLRLELVIINYISQRYGTDLPHG